MEEQTSDFLEAVNDAYAKGTAVLSTIHARLIEFSENYALSQMTVASTSDGAGEIRFRFAGVDMFARARVAREAEFKGEGPGSSSSKESNVTVLDWGHTREDGSDIVIQDTAYHDTPNNLVALLPHDGDGYRTDGWRSRVVNHNPLYADMVATLYKAATAAVVGGE